MTKGETIQEIARVLDRYENPEVALNYIANLFANYVDTPWAAQTSRKAAFRSILINFREKYDA